MINRINKVVISLLIALTLPSYAQTEFITIWNLSISGSGANQLTFGTATTGTVNYTWETYPSNTLTGSGTFSGTLSVTGLPANQKIKLKIAPTNFHGIYLNYSTDKSRLIDVTQWGTTAWTSMNSAFSGCNNLAGAGASDAPNLTNVTDMYRMFFGASSFNQPIGNWNTANVTDMSYMFCYAAVFNQPIGNWNTANVTNTSLMFANASVFNQPIGNWNTAKVTNMSGMFANAYAFNQPIGNWNTAKVTNMSNMFQNASTFNQTISGWNTGMVTNMFYMFGDASVFNQPIGNWNTANVTDMSSMFSSFTSGIAFNQPIGNWNTANVTNMYGMFRNAAAFNQPIGNWNTANVTNMSNMFCSFSSVSAFNQPIGNWNTANVTDMSLMFYNASAFNQPIGGWNTANVTVMTNMFVLASTFNQPIGNWNTAKVTDMGGMFIGTYAFNQPIGNWNTTNVTNMSAMFAGATVFNQTISGWNIGNVTDMSNMFVGTNAFNQPIGNWGIKLNPAVTLTGFLDGSGMNGANYDALLSGFNAGTVTGRTMGAAGLYYCAASAARASLISKGWTITDGGQGTNTFIATQPLANATVCSGISEPFSVSATGSNLRYLWSNNATTSGINTSVSGLYLVTVAGSCGSAVVSNTASLYNYLPTVIVAQPLVSATVCSGVPQSYTVSALGINLSYVWSNGLSNTNTMSTSVAGINYNVTVTGTCGTPQVSNSSGLTITPHTTIVTQPLASATVCRGASQAYSVSATGANVSYLWSNGATSNTINTSVAGTYLVTVSGTCGNTVSNGSIMANYLPTAVQTLPSALTICSGFSVPLTATAIGANLNYAWSNGTSGSTATVSTSGTYFVTVAGLCGTVVSNAVALNVTSCTAVNTSPGTNTTPGTNTGISSSDITQTNAISVYPNPNNGSFMIDIPNFENLVSIGYFITSMEGKVLATGTLIPGKNTIETNLSKGIYCAHIDGKVQKLIIE